MLYEVPAILGFVELFAYLQTIVPFSEIIMICIFFVSFFALKRYETFTALPSCLFITFISSFLFFLMGLLDVAYVMALAIGLGLSAVFLYFRK